jgi:predicted nucleic acid-binding protein
VTYWDSSALIPLFVEQAFTRTTRKWREMEHEILTSWHSVAECASCFCRLAREGQLSEADVTSLYGRLQSESLHWTLVTPGRIAGANHAETVAGASVARRRCAAFGRRRAFL